MSAVCLAQVVLGLAGLAAPPRLDGSPPSIVQPALPTVTERFAVAELARLLRRRTGREPSVGAALDTPAPRLHVGATELGLLVRAELAGRDPETFAVRPTGGDVILIGSGDRGTLYAVYDFAERELGCRWLAPGELWEEIPPPGPVAVEVVARTESPAYRFRYLRATLDGEPGTWESDGLAWAVRQRINIGHGWPKADLPASFAERGGFRGWMNPHDLIRNTVPPDRCFAQRPEWYAEVRGRRVNRGRNTQLCTTAPGLVEAVADGLTRTVDARPEAELIGLGQADGTAFCECDRCLALDTGEQWRGSELPVITERWLTFTNAVATRMEQVRPGRLYYTLAYHQTFRPPGPGAVRPADNLMVQVVNSRPNYLCFVHRLEAADCPGHQRFREGFERWAEITPAGLLMYEYLPHSTWCNMPYVGVHKFVDDIRWLRRHGAVGYEAQSSARLWGIYGVTLYAVAKATWNPEVDADVLLADYCRHAYHESAEPMGRFYAVMEAGLESADHITEGVWSALTPEVMAAARQALDAAHAAAGSERVKARLKVIETGFHLGELGTEAWRLAQQALADQDADQLQRAISLADEAAAYIKSPDRAIPEYSAAPGKLTSVYAKNWRAVLDRWRK